MSGKTLTWEADISYLGAGLGDRECCPVVDSLVIRSSGLRVQQLPVPPFAARGTILRVRTNSDVTGVTARFFTMGSLGVADLELKRVHEVWLTAPEPKEMDVL
jgi:hypothetical protein